MPAASFSATVGTVGDLGDDRAHDRGDDRSRCCSLRSSRSRSRRGSSCADDLVEVLAQLADDRRRAAGALVVQVPLDVVAATISRASSTASWRSPSAWSTRSRRSPMSMRRTCSSSLDVDARPRCGIAEVDAPAVGLARAAGAPRVTTGVAHLERRRRRVARRRARSRARRGRGHDAGVADAPSRSACGRVDGAVADRHVARRVGPDVEQACARCRAPSWPAPIDHDVGAVEVRRRARCERHRDRRLGEARRAARDRRLGAHAPSRGDGALEQLGELGPAVCSSTASSSARRSWPRTSNSPGTTDLRPGRHAEEVVRDAAVEVDRQLAPRTRAASRPVASAERRRDLLDRPVEPVDDRDDLGAQARRDEDRLVDVALAEQGAQDLAPLVLEDGDALEQVE